MYVNDFDDNGNIEQIVFQYNGDSSYTMCLRHDLVMQMPSFKKDTSNTIAIKIKQQVIYLISRN
ncbi:MAG: hypothetical protein CM15mP75_6620 [Flammeovirgaceae bacterium]|nr:MAG: hypothetical protein CM15mP75_6620 [Flammeovirgaceae bacterium]